MSTEEKKIMESDSEATSKLDNCVISLEAKLIPMGQKRKRGSPTLTTQALLR